MEDKFDCEKLRKVEHMNEPDPRWKHFGYHDHEGAYKTISIEEFAQDIEEIKLNSNVPEEIVIHFETAKNLALYSWNVYRFIPVSKLYAYIAIEKALKLKTGKPNKSFKELFKKAISAGWFSNEKFTQWQIVTERRKFEAQFRSIGEEPEDEVFDYLKVLLEYIPSFRNSLAHGETTITPDPYSALRDSSEIINQIYAEKA